MAYAHTTWGELKTALANRLDDPNNTHFPLTELDSLLRLTFYLFQSITGYWKDRKEFNTTANTAFYDLYDSSTNLVPVLTPTLTDTSTSFLLALQSMLWEPRSTSWTGASSQFIVADVRDAIDRRRDQLLDESGCRLTYHSPFVVPAGDGRVDLTAQVSDKIIDITRAQWITLRNSYHSVRRDTPTHISNYQSAPQFSPNPFAFDLVSSAPLQLQLLPHPTDTGRLELVTVESALPLTGAGSLLGIPDNLSWALWFGVLADLYGRGGAVYSPAQQELAQKMYEFGVEAAKTLPVMLGVELNGVTTHPVPISQFDAERPGWQGKTAGTPTTVVTVGPNLFALYPTPSTSAHSVIVEVATTVQFPADDTGFVQAGRELVEGLLDCAEFLSRFRLGAYEAGAAFEQRFQRFLKLARGYAAKAVEFPGLENNLGNARDEERSRPRRRRLVEAPS